MGHSVVQGVNYEYLDSDAFIAEEFYSNLKF